MMQLELSLLILSLIVHGQCRTLWDADLPEVSGLDLVKGKPLQLPKSYESVQIAYLKGTLYSDSLSQLHGVKVLRLKEHELTAIHDGAFCSAPDLKILEIDFYSGGAAANHLTKAMFKNCEHLEELLLKFNMDKLRYFIDQDAIEHLTLKNLALLGYPIGHVTKNFLKISPNSLKHLTLATADIEKVDADVFEDFANLESLTIRFSRNWTHLEQDLFKNLPKLKEISLRENGLRDLSWDEFKGLTNVKSLDVGSNRISSFHAGKIAQNLPNLEKLMIDLNPLPCKLKETFVEDLKKRLKHPIEVVYKFDPGYFDSCEQD